MNEEFPQIRALVFVFWFLITPGALDWGLWMTAQIGLMVIGAAVTWAMIFSLFQGEHRLTVFRGRKDRE
jgi:hypothetical protein